MIPIKTVVQKTACFVIKESFICPYCLENAQVVLMKDIEYSYIFHFIRVERFLSAFYSVCSYCTMKLGDKDLEFCTKCESLIFKTFEFCSRCGTRSQRAIKEIITKIHKQNKLPYC